MNEDRLSAINQLCERHPDVDREDIKSAYSIVTAATPASFLSFDDLEKQILEWIGKFPKKDEEQPISKPEISEFEGKEPSDNKTIRQKIQEIYDWACHFTREQHRLKTKDYLVTDNILMLKKRLERSKSQLIAAVGLQGSGKTALKQWLWAELEDTKGVKWLNTDEIGNILVEFLNYKQQDKLEDYESYIGAVMREFTKQLGFSLFYCPPVGKYEARAMKALHLGSKMTEESSVFRRYMSNRRGGRIAYSGEEERRRLISDLDDMLPKIEKFLGSKKINQIKKELAITAFHYLDTFLIDFPDYDKKAHGRARRDLLDFQHWWEPLYFSEEGYATSNLPNLVIFYQKELWQDMRHFLQGKFDVFHIKPFSAKQLADYYIDRFNGAEPFTQKALIMIAGLARGIFRWFKKYIRICLDHYFLIFDKTGNLSQNEINIVAFGINVQAVKQWIESDQLFMDWDRELIDVWPKAKHLRRKAVVVLRFLREHREVTQPEITERFFEGRNQTCSEFLTKLESEGYIIREYDGRKKLVSLAEGR